MPSSVRTLREAYPLIYSFIQSNHLLGSSCQLKFEPMASYLISDTASPFTLATADFNHDTYMDIVSVNINDATITVLLGYGNGMFEIGNTYSTGSASEPRACAVDDLNGDGWMDVVVANFADNSIAIFLGNGDGTFQTEVLIPTGDGTMPHAVVIGYINKDAQLDIAVAHYYTNEVGIFLGRGDGTFQAQKMSAAGFASSPVALVLGDFNRDNWLDIAVAGNDIDMAIVLLGRGNGSFHEAIMFNASTGPRNIASGDFNGDLILDLAVLNQRDSSVSILLGHGNGSFGTAMRLAASVDASHPFGLSVVDLDQDGHQDLIVTNNLDHSVSILLGYGDGSFQARKTIALDVGSVPFWVAAADFNDDGRLDLAVSNFGSNTVGILLRTC